MRRKQVVGGVECEVLECVELGVLYGNGIRTRDTFDLLVVAPDGLLFVWCAGTKWACPLPHGLEGAAHIYSRLRRIAMEVAS